MCPPSPSKLTPTGRARQCSIPLPEITAGWAVVARKACPDPHCAGAWNELATCFVFRNGWTYCACCGRLVSPGSLDDRVMAWLAEGNAGDLSWAAA